MKRISLGWTLGGPGSFAILGRIVEAEGGIAAVSVELKQAGTVKYRDNLDNIALQAVHNSVVTPDDLAE